MRGEGALQWLVNRDAAKHAAKWGATRFPVTEKYVAGETIDDTTAYVDGLNGDGITALVDLLGEHVEDPDEVAQVKDEYDRLLEDIVAQDLDAHLSIKLTHLGLDVDDTDVDGYSLCRENVADFIEQSATHDRFLWIDMESRDYTDTTIDMYQELVDEFDNVGLCIQSYLERSEDDIERLQANDGVVRLVKGAYDGDSDFEDWEGVGDNYRELLDDLFAGDTYFAVATHDKELIDHAQKLEQKYGKSRDGFEFQFLKGVCDDEKERLVDEGYTVVEYVPYGDDAFDYFWRRVQEHPQNLAYGIRTVADAVRENIPV